MTMLLDTLAWLLLLAGGLLVMVGNIGLLRLPDFYTRLHAAGVTDTMGAGLLLLGLTFEAGLTLVSVKIIMILCFILITSPTATHALARSALHSNLRPLLDGEEGASSHR